MSAAPKMKKLTVQEYLALEEQNERKSEFLDGEMFMMAGASYEHNLLTRNLIAEIHAALKGKKCRVHPSDQRLMVERSGLYTYPDLFIVCGKPEFSSDDPNSITNPTVIVEVLSKSTERYDRSTKFRHYKQLTTLQEYVLVSQTEVLIESFFRQPDNTWLVSETSSMDMLLRLKSVAVEIPMVEIYRDVEFPTPSMRPTIDAES